MAISSSSSPPPPHLRVFAKVAHPTPPGAPSPHVAAFVRFYLRAARPHVLGDPHPPLAPAAPATVQRTFQFSELGAFLEAGKARAAVAGMLSLLPLRLESASFQAWAGFISSVLCLAAARSQRRKLGGVIGIVRIDCFGGEVGEVGAQPPGGALLRRQEASACGGEWSCPICYEGISGHGGVEVTKIPCGHGFHGACIAKWLRDRRTCPVCRFQMPDKVAACD